MKKKYIIESNDAEYQDMHNFVVHSGEIKEIQFPETMADLGKLASDWAFIKRCSMRYVGEPDGSFFIIKDGEMYLFKETREITVSRLYHKLIWLLGE